MIWIICLLMIVIINFFFGKDNKALYVANIISIGLLSIISFTFLGGMLIYFGLGALITLLFVGMLIYGITR